MFMRLIGYPASKITILTTYNGQKHLIRDVINTRCANNPLIGKPHKVTTVDKYQGQQNDYILLSLVRTRAVGHLRDVRRLVVAMSRARLGLYIFARVALFRNCFELAPAFEQLTSRPTKLHLFLNEVFPTQRLNDQKSSLKPMVVKDMSHMANFVYTLYMGRVKQMKEYYEQMGHKWEKPGEVQVPEHEGFISSHPGEDRDTDSEDEEEAGKQLPVPMEEEPINDNMEEEPISDSMEEEPVNDNTS
nr:unnamed protein product [Callosobruchus analis]